MNYEYRIDQVGGDPKDDWRIASILEDRGWDIDGIDPIIINRAWDCDRQRYVTANAYIIRAKRECTIHAREMTKDETITEFADRCRECGTKTGKLIKDYKQILFMIGETCLDESKCHITSEEAIKKIRNILTTSRKEG